MSQDINQFLESSPDDVPVQVPLPHGAKVRFTITNTSTRTVGKDEPKDQLVVKQRLSEILEWPSTAKDPRPNDLKLVKPVDQQFFLTTPALSNDSPAISAKAFAKALGIPTNLSWKLTFEQMIGQSYVALIRSKWNERMSQFDISLSKVLTD